MYSPRVRSCSLKQRPALSSLCIGFPQHLLSTLLLPDHLSNPSPLPSMGQDTNSAANDSRKSPSPGGPQHRRGYQACDPCRKRKVKCDLGSMRSATPPSPPRDIRPAMADGSQKFSQVSIILALHLVCDVVAKVNDVNSRRLVASAKPPRRPKRRRRLPKCFAATSG